MARHMEFQNASATAFSLDVTRDVRLLGADDLRKLFGVSAAAMIDRPGVKIVAYETVNQVSNCGPAFSKEKGLVSIWILGMMNAVPQTVIIVPYKSGSEALLGSVVQSDYFGAIPPDRLKVTPEAVLFRADGRRHSRSARRSAGLATCLVPSIFRRAC